MSLNELAQIFALDGVPNSNAPFVSSWAGLITVFMTTIGAIILALIKKENKKQRVKVEHISKAVNGVEDGEPTLIQRVTAMKKDQEQIKEDLQDYQNWMGKSIQAIGKEVGVNITPYTVKDKV